MYLAALVTAKLQCPIFGKPALSPRLSRVIIQYINRRGNLAAIGQNLNLIDMDNAIEL